MKLFGSKTGCPLSRHVVSSDVHVILIVSRDLDLPYMHPCNIAKLAAECLAL